MLRNDEADTVVIYVDGKIEKKLDLNKNQEYKVNVDNGYNIIRIKDKKVRIKESDCSNQTCVCLLYTSFSFGFRTWSCV